MAFEFTVNIKRTKDLYAVDSTASVYQTLDGGEEVLVASIQDFCDPSDHRRTRIDFAQESLYFSASYDGPVSSHEIRPFRTETPRDTGIALHLFPFDDCVYLGTPEGFFPIKHGYKKDPDSVVVTVYKSAGIPQENGLLLEPLATAVQTRCTEDSAVYRIRVEEELPILSFMAVLSLPVVLS